MALVIRDGGQNNTIDISPQAIAAGSGLIELHGDNNTIAIDNAHAWVGPHITLAGGASVRIAGGCVLGGLILYASKGAFVDIGYGTGFVGMTAIMLHEPARVSIGAGCLFGSDTHVLASDMHSIVDTVTGARINPASDIVIEDRVWVGFRTVVLKGSRIRTGSVIGACSVVSGEIPRFCVAAGNPARIQRTEATWNQELLPMPPVA